MQTKAMAVTGALVLGLLASPAASAAPSGEWGDAVPVSRTGGDLWDLELSMHQDRGLAVWVRWKDDASRVLVARQRGTGGWTRPVAVPGTRGAGEVEVARDARGRARLVWTVGRRVRAAWLRRDGSTSSPVLLHRTPAGPLGTRPAYLQLAVNADGAAVVAWQTMDDDEAPPYASPEVQVVAHDATGPWREVHTLSSPDADGVRPEVFVSRAGRATVAWGERLGRAWSVRTASRRERSSWGPPRTASVPSERASIPHLAGLPSGRLALAYAFRADERQGLAVRQWSRSRGWDRRVVVRGARMPSWVDLGLSVQGATAAYSDAEDSVWVVAVSRTGERSRTRLVPEVSVFYGMHVVVNRAGDALVAWDSVRGGDHPIEAAYGARDGSWEPVTRISAARGDAFLGALGLTPDGDALAVWNGGDLADPDSSRVWSRAHTR